MYCLDDGNALLDGPATADQITIAMPRPDLSGSEPTVRLSAASLGRLIDPYKVSREPLNSVAVLPFVNIGADEGIEYFSDGLAEELLTVLSKINGLRVAARTSAFSFKGRSATVDQIGAALNVGSIVEGSIRMAGKRVRITVQLVSVADGYHIWSETYDRTMDDIFDVQDDIARSVVEELRLKIFGTENAAEIGEQVVTEVAEAVKGRADDPEAQRLMLLGRYFLDRTTAADTEKAIAYFREALDIDPRFALCWAELGRAYSIQAGKAWVPVGTGFEMALDATEKALRFETDLAEAHAQLGRIRAAYDWDLEGAAKAYDKALQIAPGNSVVMDGASVLEFKLGRLENALGLSRRVLEQDPLSSAVWHNLGLIAHAAGLLAESEKAFRRALELSPNRLLTAAMLSLVLADEGRFDEAIAEAEKEPEEFWRLWAFVISFHAAGMQKESDDALGKLLEIGKEGDSYQIAEAYAMRGEIDKAFEWLDKAIAERDAGVTHTQVSPRFRLLHADPRWPMLLENIGFEIKAE